MIPAFLHGKLSCEQENMEDLLTSSVFGLLRHVEANEGLLPVLSRARYIDGSPCPIEQPIMVEQFDFWPFMNHEGCIAAEPDVVIRLRDRTGKRYLLLIEVKFRSGKSSFADDEEARPKDQLAREWDNLCCCCESENRLPLMIYLTADFAMPRDELQESLQEFAKKRRERHHQYPLTVAWLSWRDFIPALREKASANQIISDIVAVLQHLDLHYFEGFKPASPVLGISWRIKPALKQFYFDFHPLPNITWKFPKSTRLGTAVAPNK